MGSFDHKLERPGKREIPDASASSVDCLVGRPRRARRGDPEISDVSLGGLGDIT